MYCIDNLMISLSLSLSLSLFGSVGVWFLIRSSCCLNIQRWNVDGERQRFAVCLGGS